jgi:hypothetical protein
MSSEEGVFAHLEREQFWKGKLDTVTPISELPLPISFVIQLSDSIGKIVKIVKEDYFTAFHHSKNL